MVCSVIFQTVRKIDFIGNYVRNVHAKSEVPDTGYNELLVARMTSETVQKPSTVQNSECAGNSKHFQDVNILQGV